MIKGSTMSEEQKEIRRLSAIKNNKSHSELMKKYWENRHKEKKENMFTKYLNKHNI
jgi:hypothetical protein